MKKQSATWWDGGPLIGRVAATLALAGVLLVSAAAGGCGGNASDPNRQLSNEEGEVLLKRIRDHPPRPDDLTMAEKRFLLKRMGD